MKSHKKSIEEFAKIANMIAEDCEKQGRTYGGFFYIRTNDSIDNSDALMWQHSNIKKFHDMAVVKGTLEDNGFIS